MTLGYARVSTSDQTLTAQVQALEEAGCDRIYQEKVSGSAGRLSERERLMETVRKGDTVVVTKLDRLGRSTLDLVQIVEALGERGADFKVLGGEIDTSSAQGRLVFHIFSALAEFEREMISERTREGLQAARRSGTALGRPRAITKEDLSHIQTLMRDEDVTTRSICERFDISRRTLYNYVGPEGELREKGRELMRSE